jgi:TetR/AcrR family transcriptional regulator, transcriptional repressor for nem operon
MIFVMLIVKRVMESCSMGHSKAEKAQSRERILAAASAQIRVEGLESLSVGELMRSVNLTHGGFYGHFKSRAELVAAAMERALLDGQSKSAITGNATVKAIVNSYLSPAHRDHPNTGCAIPSLAAEAGRADPDTRAVMAAELIRAFETMKGLVGDGEKAQQFAISSWSMMIGAMMISRVLAGDPLSDRVLADVRKTILQLEADFTTKNT